MTNYVKQKFQWFFDMATDTSTSQRIDINAGGNDIYKRMEPFFGAFKKFKLGTVRVRMVPAATLPVDPTGLSYEAGEQTVDPRDIFNPGLVRITNGEDMPAPTQFVEDEVYYSTMLDKRWYKFRLQSGFRRSARPLFWGVGQVHQDVTPGSTVNLFGADLQSTPKAIFESQTTYAYNGSGSPSTKVKVRADPSDYALFQTGQRVRMGWLPTDMYQPMEITGATVDPMYGLNPIPEIPLMTVYLPKAYKTKFFYRVYVEETVMFKDAVAINPMDCNDQYAGLLGYYQPIDHYVGTEVKKVMPGGLNLPLDIPGGGLE